MHSHHAHRAYTHTRAHLARGMLRAPRAPHTYTRVRAPRAWCAARTTHTTQPHTHTHARARGPRARCAARTTRTAYTNAPREPCARCAVCTTCTAHTHTHTQHTHHARSALRAPHAPRAQCAARTTRTTHTHARARIKRAARSTQHAHHMYIHTRAHHARGVPRAPRASPTHTDRNAWWFDLGYEMI